MGRLDGGILDLVSFNFFLIIFLFFLIFLSGRSNKTGLFQDRQHGRNVGQHSFFQIISAGQVFSLASLSLEQHLDI